jgi:hypothetical protein
MPVSSALKILDGSDKIVLSTSLIEAPTLECQAIKSSLVNLHFPESKSWPFLKASWSRLSNPSSHPLLGSPFLKRVGSNANVEDLQMHTSV